uniref:Uncharacterized protein n=1 Tax=Kalanchoe fedtschenkoi TaxID=63787 RepID=A0A7N1A014_KALFE
MDVERRVGFSSCLPMSGERMDQLYPMCFGVSCTFFAIKLLSSSKLKDEKWREIMGQMLQGGAQLLGLLVWRAQRDFERAEVLWKLECAEKEVEELKRRRREDAKANERVARIYATQEQNWFGERNRMRLQINALLNQLRIFEKRRAESIDNLAGRIKEFEELVATSAQALERESEKNRALQEELRKAGEEAEESRKAAARQAEEHAAESWKQKTAFIQLVSAHRQLEAELGRAFRQVEVGKDELSLILEQKVEAVSMGQKLSLEVVKLRSEAGHKGDTERHQSGNSSSGSQKRSWYRRINAHGKPSSRTRVKTLDHHDAEEGRCGCVSEQRHRLEVNAYAEQMRLRDEKIEILHWRLLSMEIESKQLQADLDELNEDRTQLRQVNMKLGEQLLEREADLHYLKSRLASKPSMVERKPAEDEDKTMADSARQKNKNPSVELEKEADRSQVGVPEQAATCRWRTDVQALGVFYKVKRLKQQLVTLERFAAEEKTDVIGETKAVRAFISSLKKQVSRYESLQSRIDELCNRMREESDGSRRHERVTKRRKTKEEMKALERYLQEALQLQRYVVATGQKLGEMLTGISVALCEVAEEASSIDMTRFGRSVRDLLKEVQKGLEIQSSRIIGDVEGTLACEEMMHLGSLPLQFSK